MIRTLYYMTYWEKNPLIRMMIHDIHILHCGSWMIMWWYFFSFPPSQVMTSEIFMYEYRGVKLQPLNDCVTDILVASLYFNLIILFGNRIIYRNGSSQWNTIKIHIHTQWREKKLDTTVQWIWLNVIISPWTSCVRHYLWLSEKAIFKSSHEKTNNHCYDWMVKDKLKKIEYDITIFANVLFIFLI